MVVRSSMVSGSDPKSNKELSKKIAFFKWPSFDVLLTTGGFGIIVWMGLVSFDKINFINNIPIKRELIITLAFFILLYFIECLYFYVVERFLNHKNNADQINGKN